MSKAMDDLVQGLETGDTPNSQNSQSGDQSNSPGDSDVNLDALVSKLVEAPALRKAIESIARSDKDKGIASAKKDAAEAKELATGLRDTVATFQSYLEKYGDEERALFEMERDQKIDSLLSGKETPATTKTDSAGADTRPWGVRQKEILESANLELNDPRVIELAKKMRDEGATPDQYLTALANETFTWATGDADNPKPNISTQHNPGKGHVAKPVNAEQAEALAAEMQELSINYSQNEKRIKEIGAVLKEINQGA